MKNNLLKKVLLVGIILLSTMSLKVHALIYVKKSDNICTLTDEYKAWKKLSDKEKQNLIVPIKCKETISLSKALSTSSGSLTDYLSLEEYNLMDVNGVNYVTPVKSQEYDNGTDSRLCWAFASNAVVETSYSLSNGGAQIDLSEKHIAYFSDRILEDGTNNSFGYNLYDNTNGVSNMGGNYNMAGTYLAQRRGPVLESQLPFTTDSSSKENTIDLKAYYNVENVYYFYNEKDSCGDVDTVNKIKRIIYNYGAVAAHTNDDGTSISTNGSSWYDTNGALKHAVTIVGWDDNYSKENFATTASGTPEGNGAWIVKNTYPSLFNSSLGAGIHYVSYYDASICSWIMYVQGVKETDNYILYTHDKLGFNGGIAYPAINTVYIKQVYNKKSSGLENLESINLYGYPDDSYELYYSTIDDFRKSHKIAEGTFDNYGYQTVQIDDKRVISSNTFYIFLKYVASHVADYAEEEETDNYVFPAFVNSDNYEDDIYYIENPEEGVSFYSFSGTSQWNETISNSDIQFYPNINVFTTSVESNDIQLTSEEPYNDGVKVTPTQGAYNIPVKVISNKFIGSLAELTVKIFDENNTDVTDNFTIKLNGLGGDEITVESTSSSSYSNIYKVTPKEGLVSIGNYKVVFSLMGKSTQQTIIIYPDSISATSIAIDGHGEVKLDGTLRLTVTVLPEDASNKSVSWSSSNQEIATVDNNGVVTGRGLGIVTITATTTDGTNLSADKQIVVIENTVLATSVQINVPNGISEFTEGDTIILTATVKPDDATNKQVIWSSSDDDIAIIGSDGRLVLKSPGSVTITATTTDGSNKSAIVTFTVKRKVVLISSIKVGQVDNLDEVSVNGTLNLYVNIKPENATNKEVVWMSSNEKVATVNQEGIVTGRKAGMVTIIASTTDGSELVDGVLIEVIDINKEEGQGTTKPNDDVDNPGTGDTFITLFIILLTAVIGTVIYMKKKGIIKNI